MPPGATKDWWESIPQWDWGEHTALASAAPCCPCSPCSRSPGSPAPGPWLSQASSFCLLVGPVSRVVTLRTEQRWPLSYRLQAISRPVVPAFLPGYASFLAQRWDFDMCVVFCQVGQQVRVVVFHKLAPVALTSLETVRLYRDSCHVSMHF